MPLDDSSMAIREFSNGAVADLKAIDEKMIDLGESSEKFEHEFSNAMLAVASSVDRMSLAMAQAIVWGNSLSETLKNIARQIASSALADLFKFSIGGFIGGPLGAAIQATTVIGATGSDQGRSGVPSFVAGGGTLAGTQNITINASSAFGTRAENVALARTIMAYAEERGSF